MLQISVTLFISLMLFFSPVPLQAEQITLPEWMMEDAFDGEYVKPFDVDVVSPVEVKSALQLYKNGNYLEALGFLKKIKELDLPDGRLDFFAFIIAECNRMLKINKVASEEYAFVASRFPSSDKVPPSLYRLLEYAIDNEDFEKTDSLYQVFISRFQQHPLITSVKYSAGMAFYIQKKYDTALAILSTIPEHSVRAHQARFLSAFCYISLKEYQKAIAIFDQIIRFGKNDKMVSEALIIAGDCYNLLKKPNEALKCYSQVSGNANRYKYSIIKTAKTILDLGQYRDVQKIAGKFLNKERSGEFFFEMATILEQAYRADGNEQEAANVSNLIHGQLIDSRLVFEIYEESDRLTDLNRNWQIIEYDAIRSNNIVLATEAQKNQKKITDLQKKYHSLLRNINPDGTGEEKEEIPHLAERRYLELLKEKMQVYEDSITNMKGEIELAAAMLKNQSDAAISTMDSLEDAQRRLINRYSENEREYLLVEKECFDDKTDKNVHGEEMQARFVDWAFIKYQDRNTLTIGLAKKISDLTKRDKNDTTTMDSTEYLVIKEEYNRHIAGVIEDRNLLIEHIKTMLEVYPKNRFNSQILFRLAELYYDLAGEIFQVKLREYEKRIATGSDTAGIEFPDYNLEKVITIYDDIIQNFTLSDLADDACFYKALALQKQGLNEEANDAMLELTEKYPESEYYAEANMSIGRYYFEHPKVEDGQGYRLAKEAYRKVLFFRDHPQYVQALYHLGWCYYMEDQYEEAIAAFKYLVEENKLDFDPSKMDEKQVVNPLLRGEAIDYIAISFDEEGKIDDAVKFLHLIGNVDYAAMVLKRMAELREEDLDYTAAISVYRRLLNEYGLSSIAPEASMNLIKLYDGRSLTDSAIVQREKFFQLYSKGSIWQEALKNDSALIHYIDSLSIMMGLFVADDYYREAEKNQNPDSYTKAAEKYRTIVERYPESSLAAEALWNLAAMLELKLNDKAAAYSNYIRFSQLTAVDMSRREQAAMNAIAIAQLYLPDDSLLQAGNIDFAARKVIEAIENYKTLFPSGNSAHKVMMSMAAIYFNRQLFSKAADIYQQILQSEPTDKELSMEVLHLFGQCKFGEEQWKDASGAFEKVWKQSVDQVKRNDAYKLLVQSEFLWAREIFNNGEYQKAAEAYRSVEERFPGSEYGDIVMFNAAESYDKIEKWLQAADTYVELVKKYPQSKYASDALFNAALGYEKAERFSRAAESYEMIVNRYPESDKVKDALFNLGFCYEKLGKMDMMAEVNERYSLLYPGEKDVEAMLLRSATFYARTGMYDKAIVVYKNFVRRYPRIPRAIEALFMIAKCAYDQKDYENALFGFNNTEQQNNNLALENLETNNYYAAEAAYYTGLIKRERFLSIKLTLPPDQLKQNLKGKSDLLSDAAKTFQRVIQYQSERMFEAAYSVGELYENFAKAIKDQERQKLDPIEAAVAEKEINTLAFQIMQNTFIPYGKVIELAQGFDSLTSDQKVWITKAKAGLERTIMETGGFLISAVQAMQNAPIPKEIREQPLHNFQYQKKVLETLEPLKNQISQYYEHSLKLIDSLKLADTLLDVCKNQYARVVYLKGADFDNLANQILKSTRNIAGNLVDDDKEELIFLLEDIVFELQDKAILLLEEALEKLRNTSNNSGVWHNSIIECLARLNPEKYGSSFYSKVYSGTDENWLVRSDSVTNWNTLKIPQDGWSFAQLSGSNNSASDGKALRVWGDTSWVQMYIWNYVGLSGVPRDGAIYIRNSGKYKLYVNSTLILSDTVGSSGSRGIDSATGITSLLKGGDNVIAAEVVSADSSASGVVIEFSALIDTTQKFQTSMKLPVTINRFKPVKKPEQVSDNAFDIDTAVIDSERSVTDAVQYRTKDEITKAIDNYRSSESLFQVEINKELQVIQQLKMKIEEIDRQLESGKQ